MRDRKTEVQHKIDLLRDCGLIKDNDRIDLSYNIDDDVFEIIVNGEHIATVK